MGLLIAAVFMWCDRCAHEIPVDAPFAYGVAAEPLCPACTTTAEGQLL